MTLTFEQALRLLAEKEPEKGFEFFEGDEDECALAWPDENGFMGSTESAYIDQDDLDEILALVGWEYEVRLGIGKTYWFACAWKKDNREKLEERGFVRGTGAHDDKLSAAKAALIAVVQRQYT